MPDRFVYHVTLDSGNVRRSPRSEVGDIPLLTTRAMLQQALRGGEATVMNDCFLTAEARGKCLLATVYKPISIGKARAPLVTIGVAAHSKCGPSLWRTLHDNVFRGPMPPLATDRDEVPPEPWCAARIDVGVLVFPGEMVWLGDFERCLAWSWLELRSSGEH